MTPLKEFRHDLGDHLADGLDAAHAKLGAQVNPPAVMVQFGSPYVEMSTYCADKVTFEALIIAPPGDLAAVADALDDMVDQVRLTLRTPSYLGHRYAFQEVTGPTTYGSGEKTFPAALVLITIEREN